MTRLTQRLTNSGIATTRSTATATWTALALYAVDRLTGWKLDADDPTVILILAGALALVHRISTVLVEIWPPLGFILFGIPRTPIYPPPPPSSPPAPDSATVHPSTSPDPKD